MFTSEPFSSVLSTQTFCGGLEFVSTIRVECVRKWPKIIETDGRVRSARRYICWRAGCCGSCGRALTMAVKYLIDFTLSLGNMRAQSAATSSQRYGVSFTAP